jgi:hypothetical protein
MVITMYQGDYINVAMCLVKSACINLAMRLYVQHSSEVTVLLCRVELSLGSQHIRKGNKVYRFAAPPNLLS